MARLKALQTFSGPDGRHQKGAEFTVRAERADWLVENRYAERIDAPTTPAKRPVRSRAKKATLDE